MEKIAINESRNRAEHKHFHVQNGKDKMERVVYLRREETCVQEYVFLQRKRKVTFINYLLFVVRGISTF